MPSKDHGWPTQVLTCSGLNNMGITEVIEEIENYKTHAIANNSFTNKRNAQELYWFHQTIEDAIKTNFYKRPEVITKLTILEQEVLSKKKSPFDAAGELLGGF
ncbi:putative periplasmic protein kinase ArgK and related GTPases of G3E family [Nonlabens ulvanivorans]|nr:putative periplasmic protein kinase ArgK and related GTPases of G3E family [Nonlabens ulvanivorans]